MTLKPSIKFSAIACSSFIIGACGLGEIVSPSGPGGLDSDGDGVVDSIDPNPHHASPDDLKNAGSGSGVGGRASGLNFQCNPEARAPKSLQRLSRTEYQNTLSDLVRMTTSDATAKSVMEAVTPLFATYPTDSIARDKPFSSMDQAVSDAHTQAMLRIGTEVAKALTSSTSRIDEVLGCSASKSATSGMASCIDGFIATFGKRALRHDLNQAERSFYREVYASDSSTVDAAGLADVITVMLNAGDFIYRVEYGKDPVGGSPSLFQLNDYEIATRLAYQFWQSTPDDALLAAAERGELSTDAGFKKQLDRVLADARAAAGLERFTREWLALDKIDSLTKNATDKAFMAFAGSDMPSPSLKEEMIQDVTKSMSYHAFKDEGTLSDWIESPYSFATSQLATIYGTPPWNGGQSAPPTFPAGQRAGLITRAALLATRHGTPTTSPILKGVLIREKLLCDEVKPPPAAFDGLGREALDKKTTRQLVEALTQKEGTDCAGCHKEKINPLGFITEGFDALGRVRKEQPLFDQNGKVVASLPVDTKSVPQVVEKDMTEARAPQDLTNMIVKSGKVEHCFAKQWVGYSAARPMKKEDGGYDVYGCELETVRAALDEGASIKEALRRYALLPQFRQRLLPPS